MRAILLLALILLGACQTATQLPIAPAPGSSKEGAGMIRELGSGELLTADQLVGRLAKASRVIVGERHDNPDHHRLQLWLLQALSERRGQGSLLLEMLTPDQQPHVDQVRIQLKITGWPDDLPEALAWQSGWDWKLYGPIVRFALTQPYPLLAANLSSAEIREIYTRAPALSGTRSNSDSVRLELLEQVRESHCGLLPESQMPAMLAVQQQRDRRMAERLLAAPSPSLLFAGAYHARKDVGVPVHLFDLGASDGTRVLMLAEQGAEVAPGTADYVWYTAVRPEQDYCAQMRK
ncbi:ChaN family lipoprotein [Pseudomonas fluorescens]|uniref:Haem-binding uptake Tiki superfamily ChaN domain-containing protein n=1 Tax=Pseudomonas fluorescens TaxID=294 RepID=A0A5E7DUT8_PSEFL|nr:ChaN family lipoprotein [Pseudomonas fluorescens]VVO10932.1 hypothetical protein PS691_03394 [Pseudomonas fluorescens]